MDILWTLLLKFDERIWHSSAHCITKRNLNVRKVCILELKPKNVFDKK